MLIMSKKKKKGSNTMSENIMRAGDRMRATYELKPVDHLHRQEFYIWEEALERWKGEGLPDDWREKNLFNYDPQGMFGTGLGLGWCEPPFIPYFEDKLLESRGDYEIRQDGAGRTIQVFTGRTHGFMPIYMKHAVSNMADWEIVSQRLDPKNEKRWENLAEAVTRQRDTAYAVGGMIQQNLVGGYMYLRALMGPEDLMYIMYDEPEVVHAAMKTWLELMDEGIRRVQEIIEIDEIFMAEDICYNHGLLISPDSMREFLLPYYQQLLSNAGSRQHRKIYYQVDTDGDCRPAIPVYSELGLARMSPFEVASGCDVVEIGRQYPNLIMSGGIDKRILAEGKKAIDAHLEYIIPAMVERGGYYPTCDHGVPDDVSFENYMYYRQRVCELDHK
jgi:hypothetical protein